MPTALPALLRRLAGPKQRRRSLYETSRGESLETRIRPAAVAAVSRATLTITGDAEAAPAVQYPLEPKKKPPEIHGRLEDNAFRHAVAHGR